MATSAANFTIHRCNSAFRTPAITVVFEQLQPANKQILILLLFPRLLQLVSHFHYKETQGFLCLGKHIIIRLFDALLICHYLYNRVRNSLVYRIKVAICSFQIFLSYKPCKTPVESLEFATELINSFKIFINTHSKISPAPHSKGEVASQSIMYSFFCHLCRRLTSILE